MLFTHKSSHEEQIIELLLIEERSAKGLLGEIQKKSPPYTIQALYLVLKILLEQEVIIKTGQRYMLSEEWRVRAQDRFSKKDDTFELAEGESVSYVLTSLVHHDFQWKNIVLPLHNAHQADPIFFYNFHYIWPYLSSSRHESERAYYQSFLEKKTAAFSLVGSKSPLDLETKKVFQNQYVQWAVGAEHFSETDYVAILGSYIITTRFSKRLAGEIASCYTKCTTLSELATALQKIGIEKKKVRLIIERDRDKAKKLRKKLSKEFFVPQELIKEFGLY